MTTVKIVELLGTSSKSWQDAAKAAVKEAGKTIRNIRGIDVINQTAKIEDGEIVEYRVNLKISFKVEEERTQMKIDLENRWKEFNKNAHEALDNVEKTGTAQIEEFDKAKKNLEKMIKDTREELKSANEESKKQLRKQLEEVKRIRADMEKALEKWMEKVKKSKEHLDKAIDELK